GRTRQQQFGDVIVVIIVTGFLGLWISWLSLQTFGDRGGKIFGRAARVILGDLYFLRLTFARLFLISGRERGSRGRGDFFGRTLCQRIRLDPCFGGFDLGCLLRCRLIFAGLAGGLCLFGGLGLFFQTLLELFCIWLFFIVSRCFFGTGAAAIRIGHLLLQAVLKLWCVRGVRDRKSDV